MDSKVWVVNRGLRNSVVHNHTVIVLEQTKIKAHGSNGSNGLSYPIKHCGMHHHLWDHLTWLL